MLARVECSVGGVLCANAATLTVDTANTAHAVSEYDATRRRTGNFTINSLFLKSARSVCIAVRATMAQCACDITPHQRVFSLARILSAENAAGFSARTEVLELHVMREGSSHAAM